MTNTKLYAIITVEYKDSAYISIPIELIDGSQETIIINDIANRGTDNLTVFKMPIDIDEYIVFSRKQLDECIFIIKLIEEKPKISRKKKEVQS